VQSINGPSSICDPYLLERSWLRAIEEFFCQKGHDLKFCFEIDLYIRSGPDLPEKPDNPK
jgi:hypothetical protein